MNRSQLEKIYEANGLSSNKQYGIRLFVEGDSI